MGSKNLKAVTLSNFKPKEKEEVIFLLTHNRFVLQLSQKDQSFFYEKNELINRAEDQIKA